MIPQGRGRSKYGKRSKFGNVRTNGFASKREYRTYLTLKALESAMEISDLKTQVRFPLKVNGELVTTYIADFTFYEPVERRDRRGQLKEVNMRGVVADAKGYRTPEYKLKKALMKAIHGIEIREL